MLTTNGYLRVQISQKAGEKINAIFEAGRLFFQDSLNRKILNSLTEDMGYRSLGVEYSRSPLHPDQVESFSVSARLPDLIMELHSKRAQVLGKRMLDAFEVFESVAEAVTVELANKLSTQPAAEKLHGAFHKWSRLQLNYSRPDEAVMPLINESHEDGDLVTVTCVTGPGLEIQVMDKEFIPLTTTFEELLVMPGEIAWLLSGGQVRPLYHRVRAHTQNIERMALLFFGDIDPALCKPWLSNEINANVDISEKVRTSVSRFGLKGFEIDRSTE
jgi:isopenicillin N synthase-like dioxygenase